MPIKVIQVIDLGVDDYVFESPDWVWRISNIEIDNDVNMLVCLSGGSRNANDQESITFRGVSFTEEISQDDGNVTGAMIWSLRNPPTGIGDVEFVESGTSSSHYAILVGLSGVDTEAATIGTAQANGFSSGGDTDVNVDTLPGAMCLEVSAFDDNVAAVQQGEGQNVLIKNAVASTWNISASWKAATGGLLENLSWTHVNEWVVMCAFAVAADPREKPKGGYLPMPFPMARGSRLFNESNGDYLQQSTIDAPTPALTYSCWFKADGSAGDQALVSNGDIDTTDNLTRLYLGGSANRYVHLRSRMTATGNDTVLSLNQYVDNVWNHAAGLIQSSVSRYAYLNGIPGTQGTASRTPENLDTMRIGALAWNETTPNLDQYNGAIAEVAVWDIGLLDIEIKALAAGADPLTIRPEHLYSYTPLNGDQDFDIIREVLWTKNGSPGIGGGPLHRRPINIGKLI